MNNILQICFHVPFFQNSADNPYLIPSATCLACRTLLNFSVLTKPNFLIIQYLTLPSHFAILIKCQLKSLCFLTLLVSIRKIYLTEVFSCFFLSCKANARVKPAKPGHGPHSS